MPPKCLLPCWRAVQVHDVVDGKQRLTTLLFFRKGHFPDGTPFVLQVRPGLPGLLL